MLGVGALVDRALRYFVTWQLGFFGSDLCRSMAACHVVLQLFGQNRDAEVASLRSLHHTELQNFHDFVHCGASLECVLEVGYSDLYGHLHPVISGMSMPFL